VWGISATPERFVRAIKRWEVQRTSREVSVPIEAVRSSGLLKRSGRSQSVPLIRDHQAPLTPPSPGIPADRAYGTVRRWADLDERRIQSRPYRPG